MGGDQIGPHQIVQGIGHKTYIHLLVLVSCQALSLKSQCWGDIGTSPTTSGDPQPGRSRKLAAEFTLDPEVHKTESLTHRCNSNVCVNSLCIPECEQLDLDITEKRAGIVQA